MHESCTQRQQLSHIQERSLNLAQHMNKNSVARYRAKKLKKRPVREYSRASLNSWLRYKRSAQAQRALGVTDGSPQGSRHAVARFTRAGPEGHAQKALCLAVLRHLARPHLPSDKSSARLKAKAQAIKGIHLAVPHKKILHPTEIFTLYEGTGRAV